MVITRLNRLGIRQSYTVEVCKNIYLALYTVKLLFKGFISITLQDF